MGVVDKIWVNATCEDCAVAETISASEKGSGWGSSWNELPAFKHFDAKFTGGGSEMPDVVSATCNKCGKAVVVKSECGFGRPIGY